MSTLTHTPVQQALSKLRTMSADEEARYWAEAREKALRDEVTLLEEARIAGLKEGEEKGRIQTARAMLQDGQLKVSSIAQYTGLSEDQVRRLAEGLARH